MKIAYTRNFRDKNKSFVKKAKIYNEEKTIPSKAPVASVKISNISKTNPQKVKKLMMKYLFYWYFFR